MSHEGGGSGRPCNPYSGPVEQKLMRVLDARIDTLYAAARQWDGARETLDGVTSRLETDRKALASALGANSQTAQSAAAAYQAVQTSMEARSTDLQKGYDALEASAAALSSAQSACYDLGPMPCDPTNPDSDLERLLDPGGMLRRARHEGEVRAREARAQAALDSLDEQLDESARGFAGVAGEPVPDYSGAGSSRSTGAAAALAPGASAPQPVATVTPGSAGDGHLITTPPRGPDPHQPHVPLPVGPGSATPGAASGGPEITTPGQSTPVGGSNATGSTAPTGVGAGAAAAGALGAGAVSGAGSVATAGRGGAMRGMLPGTSAGAIGKSTTSATRGPLGRTPMVPGPTTTAPPTRTGAGVGSGQTGKGGSRGSAGGRGTPLPAAATGGSRGRRDQDRERQADHLVIDDEQSWLDDEGVTDPVID